MVHFQNTYTPGMPGQTINGRPLSQLDWSTEITPGPENQTRPASDTGIGGMSGAPGDLSGGAGGMSGGMSGMSGSMGGMTGGMGEASNGMMGMSGGMMASRMRQNGGELDMRTGLPDEVIQAPTTVDEAYRGSLKAMLARNVGNYVVATFLVGTTGTVAWEGVLYDVGNDFVTIYQPARERYIVIDIYSLKYIEFYDTRRRAMCEEFMRQNGWQNDN